MLREFFAAPGAGRDRDGPRAERFSTGDVPRRVADDIDLGGGKFPSVFFFRARAGECAKLVAVVVIVRESAELEKVPDAIMTELQLRAA